MKFNALCNRLIENNNFMDGIDTYELMEKPVYYWSEYRYKWLLSGIQTVGGLYKLLKERIEDPEQADTFLAAMKANRVYNINPNYYTIDRNKPNPKASNI